MIIKKINKGTCGVILDHLQEGRREHDGRLKRQKGVEVDVDLVAIKSIIDALKAT